MLCLSTSSRALVALAVLALATACKSNSAAQGSEFAGGSGRGGAAGAGGGTAGTAGTGGSGGVAGSDAGGDGCAPTGDSGYGPCEKGSVVIPKGGRYVTEDGCQSCTCTSDGGVSCKDRSCDLTCSDGVFVYYEGLLNLQSCKAHSDCTGRGTFGLQCPCPLAINKDAGHQKSQFESAYEAGLCNAPCNAYTCKACRAIVGAHCDQGFCVTGYGAPIIPDPGKDGGADAGPDAADAGINADAGDAGL